MTVQAGAFHRRNFDAQTYESVTVEGTAIGLTSGTYGTRRYALITVETAPIRFSLHGTDPTAGVIGHLVNPGDIIRLDSNEDIASFKAIRETGVSGVLKVTYSELKLTA